MYNNLLKDGERGDSCIDCDKCLEKCPQHIEIPDWLAKVHEELCQEESG